MCVRNFIVSELLINYTNLSASPPVNARISNNSWIWDVRLTGENISVPVNETLGEVFNLTISDECNMTIYYYSVDKNETPNVESQPKNVTVRIDKTPPASITTLDYTNGTTWINWTWTNPTDPLSGFNYTEVWIDGTWQANTSNPFYNATGLSPYTTYEIGTRTLDVAENIGTWFNNTAKTLLYGVNLTVAGNKTAEKIAAPGVNATYILTVENIGTIMDNYTLNITYNETTAWLNRTSVTTLPPRVTADVLLNVTSAIPGNFIVNVTVNSTTYHVSSTDTVSTRTAVNNPPTLTNDHVSPAPLGGGIGGGRAAPRDTDGDGISDVDEILAGTDWKDPCDPNPECAACLVIRPPTPIPIPPVTPTQSPSLTPTPTPTPTPPAPVSVIRWFIITAAIVAAAISVSAAYLVLRRKK